ncbi:MAG: TlpA family protein disulfide reductase [Balneolaceae bacterium]|nr:TlpA family protein disulfide reductase [Balneolaceae bacterium]
MNPIRPVFTLLCLAVLFISCGSKSDRNNPRSLSTSLAEKDAIVWSSAFEDLEENEVRLADYKGKVVLVDFWESWCGPCLQTFPVMDSLKNEYPEDFVILAVNLNSSDDKSDVISFKDEHPYNFEYLLDTNAVGPEVIELGIPFKLYFDTEGYLIKAEVGVSGNDYQKTKEIIEKYKES